MSVVKIIILALSLNSLAPMAAMAAVTNRSLGTVEAIERSFRVDRERLLSACTNTASDPNYFQCVVREVERNGTEVLSGHRVLPEFYEENTYLLFMVDGYIASTRARNLTEAQTKISALIAKNSLLDRPISVLLHWVPNPEK